MSKLGALRGGGSGFALRVLRLLAKILVLGARGAGALVEGVERGRQQQGLHQEFTAEILK